MSEIPEQQTEGAVSRATIDKVGSYAFGYLLAAVLLGTLIWAGGVWNFLANTRLLSVLINAGVIEYHDAQTGWVQGIPDLDYYLKSQDPIKWPLVELAALVFVAFWLIKATQFHHLARFTGVPGNFTQHARAYIEGLGINRLLPYNQGHVWLAGFMSQYGAPVNRLAQAVYLGELATIFEITIFALFGLFVLGWSMWLGQIFWGLVILGLAWFLSRPHLRAGDPKPLRSRFHDARRAVSELAKQPLRLTSLALLSLLAFGLEDVAAYLIAMAFTSKHVVLNVQFSVLLMGIVGGYIARLIPLTPGGVGQFEWGFAAGLYLGGLGFPECVAIAVLDNFIRYVTGSLMMIWVYILRVDYSYELFKRVDKTQSI